MKHFLNLLLLLLSVTTHADNIVTVYPKGGEARVVSLEVVNENIIRVRATSKETLPQKSSSLMIVGQEKWQSRAVFPTAQAENAYTVSEDADEVVVKTKNVRAVVSKQTGRVTFFDSK